MPSCRCVDKKVMFEGLSIEYKRILWVVILINALMFFVEFSASFFARSQALQADALDFLADTLTYSITFLVIGHTVKWRAGAALFKGFTLLIMGLWVIGATIYSTLYSRQPIENIMGSIAFSAFLANLTCTLLLMKYRNGDSNIRSVWLCSRNDTLNNLTVLIAAGAVYLSQSYWPDLIAAFLISGLFLHSASLIFKQAWQEWRNA